MNKIEILQNLAELIEDICAEAEKTLDTTEVDAFFETFVESVDPSEIDCLGIWGSTSFFQHIGADENDY
jgi:hypothetical protein